MAMQKKQKQAQLIFIISQIGIIFPWVGEPAVFSHTGSQVLTLGGNAGDLYLWGIVLFELNLWLYPKKKCWMNISYVLINISMIWAFFTWPLAFINDDINIAFSFVMLFPGYIIAFCLNIIGVILQNIHVHWEDL